MSMLRLVLKICGVGIQKGSEAKGKSVWLKTFKGGGGGVGGFKSKLQVEDPALKNKSCRFGCWIGQ